MARHWVLVGLMGSGKTTVGRDLARRSGRPFEDNDAQLLRTTGRSAREIESELGFDALHELERAALAVALDEGTPAVIAAAASVVDDAGMRTRLERDAIVIWLQADVDELARRVTEGSHRPLAPDVARQLREQALDRSRLFSEIADVIVDAAQAPETILDDVMPHLIED